MTLFLFKRLIGVLISPLTLTCIFLFLSLTSYLLLKYKKLTKILLSITFILLISISFPQPVWYLAHYLEKDFQPFVITNENKNFFPYAIVVLGSGVKFSFNKQMPALTRLSSTARARLIEGVRLSKIFPNALLITCGAGSHSFASCAEIMSEAAIELGVDAKRIISLDTAVDTAHEAKLVKKLVDNKNILLVTSAVHMARASNLFSRQSIDFIPAPCDFISSSEDPIFTYAYYYYPKGKSITDNTKTWHEYLGAVYYYFVDNTLENTNKD